MAEPLTIITPSDREIIITRAFDAPQDLVFRCYSEPDLIRRWYGLPDWQMTECVFEARVGGRWRFVTRGPDGFELASGGEITEFVRPVRIVSTEHYDMDWTGGGTVNTVSFSRQHTRTVVTTLLLYTSKEARDGALATPMAEGMEIGFVRLEETLAPCWPANNPSNNNEVRRLS